MTATTRWRSGSNPAKSSSAAFGRTTFSEPVREHIELSELFVIQGGGLIRWGVADVDEQELQTL